MRKELPVEREQVVELECPLELAEEPPLHALRRRERAAWRQHRRERRELSDTRSNPYRRAHVTVSATSHSLNPFGLVRRRGIEDSESVRLAGETAMWKNPATAPAASRPTTNKASRPPTSKSEPNAIVKPR